MTWLGFVLSGVLSLVCFWLNYLRKKASEERDVYKVRSIIRAERIKRLDAALAARQARERAEDTEEAQEIRDSGDAARAGDFLVGSFGVRPRPTGAGGALSDSAGAPGT